MNKNSITAFPETIYYQPNLRSRPVALRELLEYIESNTLVLPFFQRGYVWKKKDVVEFLNYILFKRIPATEIIIGEFEYPGKTISEKKELIGNHYTIAERKEIEYNGQTILSLVDGQQRITSLYWCYTDDYELKKVVLDAEKGNFVLLANRQMIKDTQIPVGILFNKSETPLKEYLTGNVTLEKVFSELLVIRNKFLSSYFPCNFPKDLDVDEQIDYFITANKKTIQVSADEVSLIKWKRLGVDVINEFTKPFRSNLKDFGYHKYIYKQKENVSFPLCTLIPAYEMNYFGKCKTAPFSSNKNTATLCEINNTNEIRIILSETLRAEKMALEFIHKHRPYIRRLEYISYIVGYLIHFNINELVEGDSNYIYLMNWLISTEFRNLSNTERRKVFIDLIYGINS